MSELTYLWFKFFWELYLGFREKSVYVTTDRQHLPDEVQQIFNEEALARARSYSSDRVDFLILKAFYETVLNTGFVLFNGIQLFWNNSEALFVWAGISASDALTTCVFVLLMNSFNALTWLPLELLVHFFLEEKHGFNRLSLGFFAKDKLKLFLISQLITLFLTYVVVYIVVTGGEYFYIYLWVFLVLVFFIVNAVYPDYVAPIFDTFSPLPVGELRTKIQALAATVDYPIDRVYILESSKRTYHSDAYQVGLYKSKRIVLLDSLLQGQRSADRGLSNDEVVSVVGHELGHWTFNHILKLALVSLFMCLIMLIVYGPSMKEKFLQRQFDVNEIRPLFGVCSLVNFLLPSRAALFSVGLLWVSRSFELQADGFAGGLGLASHLRTALVKVHRDNLLFPVHDWLYAMSYHHHPSLLDRLQALNKYN